MILKGNFRKIFFVRYRIYRDQLPLQNRFWAPSYRSDTGGKSIVELLIAGFRHLSSTNGLQ